MKIIPLAIPTPFYIGDVNVYLIKEEPLTLIDVGPKTKDAETVLRDKLRHHGVRLEDIRRIVLTHAHEDHCGLAQTVRSAAPAAKVFVHGWETGHLFGRSSGAEHRNLLMSAGVPETIFRDIEAVYRDASLLIDALEVGEFSKLEDEMELEFAAGTLKVLHTPGHTPGSCSFFREADRTLIAGDTILKRITPNPIVSLDPIDATRRFPSLAEYLVSLARIRVLSPTLVCGGHGEPIFDFEEIFHRYVRSIDERQRRVVELVSKDGATAFEIAQKLFPEAIGKNIHGFLAISETIAHLDYATDYAADYAAGERKIAIELRKGVEFYRKL